MSPPGRVPAAALEEALAIAGVGSWLWYASTGRAAVSGNFHGLLGYPADSLPQTPQEWLALAHADERPQLAKLLDCLAEGTACGFAPFTLRLRHGGGLWHWFEVRVADQPFAGDATSTVVTFNDVTQQKQTEAALRDSQLRFRALYNTAPLAFILWDRQGHITEWNRRAEQMFGWAAEEIIGKQVHRLLLPPEHHQAFTDSVRAVMHNAGDGIFHGPALGKNGLLLACNWYNVALRTPQGKLIGILSLLLDVTQERLAQRRIEKSEKIYRTLVETSPDAILLLGLDGGVQMTNQQASRLFGLDELAALGRTRIRALIPADQDAGFLDDLDDFSGFIATRQLAMQSLEGRRFDAATAYTTVMDSRGEASGIVLFVRDVTDKLQAERELEAHRENLERLVQERTFELAEAKETLSKIIDGSPVPTLVLDAEHRITHWNAACEQIIGVRASEMVGTRNQWKAFYPTQRPIMADLVITGEMSRIQELYSSKYRRSRLVQGGYEAEDYFPSFNRWLFFTAAPLRDQQGRIIGAIETLQDITERKQAEIALTDAKHAAEAAAETKASFLANMSHEIRTPMNAVIGLAHLLLKGDLTGKQRDYIARIHGAAKMLLGLINDVLDFSKIEAGQMHLEETEFTLDDVLDNVSSVLLHRAQEKGLELQYVVEPDVPSRLLGDPLRLAQVLVNLIGNAVKFTASGAISVFVRRVPTERADNGIQLEFDVQDSGIGMTAEQQKNLFQAFSQADTSITRKYGGTGLGLAICKRLVELMQGDIWVTSQASVGSTFTFTACFRPGSPQGELQHSGVHRTLVVDDNPLARAVLVRLFEKYGCSAVAAGSGPEALALLADARTAPFEFVTIDLNMPGMDGLELAEAIGNQISPPPKLIMVTAADTTSLEEQERLSGFAAVINKPVTAAQIGKLLADAATKPAPEPGQPAPLAGLRILLVDDMPTNCLIAREILESFGVTVDTAENGLQAVNKLLDEGRSYDIVLMDVQMPEMDGLEATRRLRATLRCAKLPIIAMTAHALDSERERCRAAGMDDFLSKPIDPELLQDKLLRWRPAPAGAKPTQEKALMTPENELPDLPGIDKAEGLRRMMNKPRLYEKVLRDFHARFIDEPQIIRAAIDSGDLATAERRAHSTKGLAGTIGAPGLQDAAKALETGLREGDMALESLFTTFESELRQVIHSIASGFAIDQGQ